jgi:hypothetical protein
MLQLVGLLLQAELLLGELKLAEMLLGELLLADCYSGGLLLAGLSIACCLCSFTGLWQGLPLC